MGILDSKTRIMDTIITTEGRRQLGRGNFRPEFATFTDGQAFYEEDFVSGSTDARDRFLFEATSLPSDKIFLEYDDSGRLLGSPDVKISIDAGLEGSGILLKDSNSTFYTKLSDPTSFAKIAQTLVTGSIENIKRNQLLSSQIPTEFNDKSFTLSSNKIDFIIDNYQPFGRSPLNYIKDIEELPPFLHSEKLSHIPNFKFLPPVNSNGQGLSLYEDLNESEIINFRDLIDRIGELPNEANLIEQENVDLTIFGSIDEAFVNAARLNQSNPTSGKPRESIHFLNTSLANNIFADVHEIKTDENSQFFEKMSVIDFGSFIDNSDPARPEKRVYFVGKVKEGVGKLPTFINIFTLIFD